MLQLNTIETPKGNVFTLSHNIWAKQFTASGPLQGGRSLVRLSETVRVSTAEKEYDDAVRDLIDQLVRLGF